MSLISLLLIVSTGLITPSAGIGTVSAQTANPTENILHYLKSSSLNLEITVHPASANRGLAVFLPQEHSDPTTTQDNSANDDAVIAQKELAEVITLLTDKTNIGFVMAEGDMFGPVPANKIERLKKMIENNEQLSNLIAQLKNAAVPTEIQELKHAAIGELSTIASQIERETTLAGAPYNLKAKGANYILYGAENEMTFKQSAELVRQYIYLSDRLNQLSGQSTLQPMYRYASLYLTTGQTSMTAWKNLNAYIQNSNQSNLTNLCRKIDQLLIRTQPDNQTPIAPNRADNPYAGINDRRPIEQMLAKTMSDINTIVIDKRNEETAVNFARGLNETSQTTGILQFGAGHETGLVPALNRQGLSVIVVTVPEVGARKATAARNQTSRAI